MKWDSGRLHVEFQKSSEILFVTLRAVGIESFNRVPIGPRSRSVDLVWISTWGKLPARHRGMKAQCFFGKRDKLEAYPTPKSTDRSQRPVGLIPTRGALPRADSQIVGFALDFEMRAHHASRVCGIGLAVPQ